MKWLLKLPKIRRKLYGSIWRRLLSKPAKLLLQSCFGARIHGDMTLVGWPIFKGDGLIEIGDRSVLVSSPLGNPIGLFRPCIIEAVWEKSVIKIGNGFAASGVCIVAETKIVIGNNVSIGANATIIDTDFHAVIDVARSGGRCVNSKPIRIEDDVWIGMNAVILKGVTIQRGAVIGANAVVTKNVPAGARAVGNPAQNILS